MFVTIPNGYVGIIERCAKFNRIAQPGFTMMIPFVEKLAYKIPTTEQNLLVPVMPVILSDNETHRVGFDVHYEITNPQLFAYGTADTKRSMELLLITISRNVFGQCTKAFAESHKESVHAEILSALQDGVNAWGIKIITLAF